MYFKSKNFEVLYPIAKNSKLLNNKAEKLF